MFCTVALIHHLQNVSSGKFDTASLEISLGTSIQENSHFLLVSNNFIKPLKTTIAVETSKIFICTGLPSHVLQNYW